MLTNPKIFEVNTRIWLKKFGDNLRLSEVPVEYFVNLKKKGFDIIWLMGIWKTCPSLIKECCFSVDLVSSYYKSLKDWSEKDVIGSPYSIDDYVLNPALGTEDDLHKIKETINSAGLSLLVDFIPNHFSAASHLVDSRPELFLPGDEELLQRDSYTFFRAGIKKDKILAHGRDPLFPPWTDTVQVNYFSETAREMMTDILIKLAAMADGVRCDMAMLPLNNVFHNTWIGVVNRFNYAKPSCEFWKSAIQSVKVNNPDFIFMGEAYWDLEWHLQQMGFDYTYDKILTDRLAYNDITGIKLHLSAENNFQQHSVRFIENHDEPRAVTRFGKMKSLAAATVISTIQGMKFYYDGQLDGKKIKLPLQLGREPEERISKTVSLYYNKLLEITSNDVFTKGEWRQVEVSSSSPENLSYENFLSWMWKYQNNYVLVVINYAESTSQCRIKLKINSINTDIVFTDLLTGDRYYRNISEIQSTGLFVELKPYQSHIFSFKTE